MSSDLEEPTNNYEPPFQTEQNKPIDFYTETTKSQSITVSWDVSAFAPVKTSLIKRVKNLCSRSNDSDDESKNEKDLDSEEYQTAPSRTASDGSTIILDNVTGIVKPGQLCAIMGASGAGKTTLLNVINFRNQTKLEIEGEIKLNGTPTNWNEISKCSGYVQQDDLFIGTMTVREHLTFLAMLKMGRYVTNEEKKDRIEDIITQTNLAKAQDTYIGVPGVFKGISGGEKRRLAFASEILTNPPLLFCDEPTSGLDAFMAIGLVEIMRDLADNGKTIICTIHQPSTQIFEKFDTLCLLSEGRVAYFGPRQEALRFFSSLNFNCPSTYNPADFYIKTLAILPEDRNQYLIRSKAICDAYDSSNYNSTVSNDIAYSDTYDKEPIVFNKKSDRARFLVQLKWLLWRNYINDFRTPIASKILVVQTLVIGVFFGLIYLQLGTDENAAMDKNGLLFILMMNTGFAYLFPILNTFCGEMPVFYRDHKNNMYSTFAYYICKQIAELPKYIFLSFILVTIIYWMANVKSDGGVYVQIALTMVLSSQTSAGLGYFLSVVGESIDTGTAVAAPILIPLILFAGFFLNNASVPDYFIWIKYVSWFFYTYDALLIELWGSTGKIPCSTAPNITSNCERYASGDAVLELYSVKKSDLTRDIVVVFALGLALRVLGFAVLAIKAKRK